MTTFLIDSYKQFIIEHIEPGNLHNDIRAGLKIKEDMINSITEEYLRGIIPNYDEMEQNLGEYENANNHRKFICGESEVSELDVPPIADVLYYRIDNGRYVLLQDNYRILSSDTVQLKISIKGTDFESYNCKLLWASVPDNSILNPTTTYELIDNEKIISSSTISFNPIPGIYTLSIEINSTKHEQYVIYKSVMFSIKE